MHPREWYADHDVDLRLGDRVTALNVAARTVTSASGDTRYDRLVLATGSVPRHLAMADAAGPSYYLRTLEDTERLLSTLTKGARIGIVGAGWIGLRSPRPPGPPVPR